MNLSKYKNILENKMIGLIGIISVFGGLTADSLNGGFGYVLIIVVPMFLYALWDEHKKYKTLNIDTVHIPLIIKIGEGSDPKYVLEILLKYIESQYDLSDYKKNMLKYTGVNFGNLVFDFKGDINNFNHVMNFARNIRNDMILLENNIGNRIKFHIAYYKKPTYGFLIGTIFRTEGIFIYQNNDYENIFNQVININSRKYKESVQEFCLYTKEDILNNPTDNTEILIVLNSASHTVNENSNDLKKYKNKIRLTLNSNGTIPYDTDWTCHVQEIYTVLNQVQQKYNKIILAHSMPEALSVALGMAIENYWNVDITQYNTKTLGYDNFYSMNQIEYFN